MAQVYWLHLKEHTDMSIEGYIGVSFDSSKRIWAHRAGYTNAHLSNAFNKYGNRVILENIFNGEEKSCYALEEKLRPDYNIGWNIAPGGVRPPRELCHTPQARRKRIESCKKPKSSTENYHKPKGENHKMNIAKALKGRSKPTVQCPHCSKAGYIGNMLRWHFDNCKRKEVA